MCVLEPGSLFLPIISCLSLCKWKPSHQSHCLPSSSFWWFSKEVQWHPLSSRHHRVVTSVGPTKVCGSVTHHGQRLTFTFLETARCVEIT